MLFINSFSKAFTQGESSNTMWNTNYDYWSLKSSLGLCIRNEVKGNRSCRRNSYNKEVIKRKAPEYWITHTGAIFWINNLTGQSHNVRNLICTNYVCVIVTKETPLSCTVCHSYKIAFFQQNPKQSHNHNLVIFVTVSQPFWEKRIISKHACQPDLHGCSDASNYFCSFFKKIKIKSYICYISYPFSIIQSQSVTLGSSPSSGPALGGCGRCRHTGHQSEESATLYTNI